MRQPPSWPTEQPGWVGAFVRDEAPGALTNGSRVVKVDEDQGDGTPLGTGGEVLGSLDVRGLPDPPVSKKPVSYLYFIEWDNRPRCAVMCVDWKLGHEDHDHG